MNKTSTRPTEEWQAFWLAMGFLTRIPMFARIDYSQRLMNQSSLYFPVVGLLLGAVYCGAYQLFQLWFSPLAAILLVMILHLWLTGAFHEDGLADSMDALGGGYTVEKRLEIMKDSRIGTYGAVALAMALGLKAVLLMESASTSLALLLAPAISRLTPLLLMGWLPYVTHSEQSKSKPVADSFSRRRLAVATAFTVAVAMVASVWHTNLLLWAIIATLGVAIAWGRYLRSQLGGYTGDALGASVVMSELALLLLLTT